MSAKRRVSPDFEKMSVIDIFMGQMFCGHPAAVVVLLTISATKGCGR